MGSTRRTFRASRSASSPCLRCRCRPGSLSRASSRACSFCSSAGLSGLSLIATRRATSPSLVSTDLLGRGEARAGLAQLVAHGVARVLGRAQFVGKRTVHQRLAPARASSVPAAGLPLPAGATDRNRPGKQEEERKNLRTANSLACMDLRMRSALVQSRLHRVAGSWLRNRAALPSELKQRGRVAYSSGRAFAFQP